MSAFTIRPATMLDLPEIEGLLERSYPKLLKPDYPPSLMVTAVPLMTKPQPGLVETGTYYVAQTDAGAILGAGGWTPYGPLDDKELGETDLGTAHIRHFAVDPAALRRGVARGLMNYTLEEAHHFGAKQMQCYSTRTAREFYQAMGFAAGPEIEIELMEGISFPVIEMHRRL